MADGTFVDLPTAARIVYGPQGPTPAQLRALRALDALYEHVNAMPKQAVATERAHPRSCLVASEHAVGRAAVE
jgi:hypothetical protein